MRPADTEFAPFYASYIARVPETDPLPALEAQPTELLTAADRIAPDDELFRYAPDKWSVRQTFGHLIDTERVMGYRAFCIARGEVKPLPGFDEKDYVAARRFGRTIGQGAGARVRRRPPRKPVGHPALGAGRLGSHGQRERQSPFQRARLRTSWPATCGITWRCCGSGTASRCSCYGRMVMGASRVAVAPSFPRTAASMRST